MCKIMIIDDNQFTLTGVSEALELNGYNNRAYRDPIEAIKAYKRNPCDIVISDYKMPLMDGFEIVGLVKDLNPDVSFIVYTGYPDKEFLSKADEYQVLTFSKPLELRELVRCIDAILLKKGEKNVT